jgi:ABC-type nitrate/sulfonate/bicarbonate transport system substrate-binding protein
MNKRLLLVTGAIVVLGIIAGIVLLRPRPFTVGLQAGSINYPMMHAVEGGFFERERLKPNVQVFNSANDALDAVLGGSIFIDSVIPIQNIAAIQEQRPNTIGILAVLLSDKDHPLDYLVVPAKSSINSPADLTGKTIVVFPGSYSETVTSLTLAKLGVKDVKFIKRAPADMPQALQTGEADAGVFYDPAATQAEVQGWGRIIERGFWENHLIPVIVVGAYAYNKAEADRNPDVAQRVFTALENAINDAQQNPDKAKMSIQKYLKTPEDIIKRLPTARVELAQKVDPNLLKQTLELYAANGIIPKATDLSSLLRKP